MDLTEEFEGKDAYELAAWLDNAKKLLHKYETSGTQKWFREGTIASIDKCIKHKAFFAAGAKFHERLFMAANRVGKSIGGAYELACHVTGEYPVWWEGRRFDKPIQAWAAGKTGQTTRDTVQKELLGEPGAWGTGMIPLERIVRIYPKSGIPNAVEMIEVESVNGGKSIITFKSYDQNVQAFYGTARDVIWLDEECPELIYSECLIRTMTTNGIVYVTFTPLHGLTPFIVNFTKNATFLEGALPIIPGLGEEDDVHSFRR
jgi:phage terminase large subunit-like protein